MQSASRLPPARRGAQPSCILLVEDREDDALFLKRSLRKAGITMPVKVVQDGAQAVAYLQGNPPFSNVKKFPIPSIVMLDIHMPNKNGFEVLEWLRSQRRFEHLFVVVVTVSGKMADIARAYSLGANSFITKPCHPEDIHKLAQSSPSHWSLAAQTA